MYQVKFYKGDYSQRQKEANEDKCVAYVEHHFNSGTSESNYTVVITGANASQTSKNWGQWYASAVSREFNISLGGTQGIMVGGYDGRGDANLKLTNMPAILLEPLFASNPQHAEIIRSDVGQTKLAQILCESIQRFFQKGGLIGFSVGHKYKTSKPADRGADVVGGGSEADYAEAVLKKAEVILKTIGVPQEEREIRVVQNNTVLLKQTVDPDANIQWDAVRGVLNIS